MPSLDALTEPYDAILCDIWGVVHDGARLLPGAARRLTEWRRAGKAVILVTNAPRPASTVQQGLDRLGLPREAYDAVTSSGEAGIIALTSPPRGIGFLGTAEDRADLVAHGVLLIDEGFSELVCTGLDEFRDDPAEYDAQLRGWAERGVTMHCLNPDRVVIHCGRREACAGALADMYEAMGGEVAWYGKPNPPIYAHALALAGNPQLHRVLAVGDGLATDMLGAALLGVDAIFVTGGIHAGEAVSNCLAALGGPTGWAPLAAVPDLG